MIEVDPDALREARRLDAEGDRGRPLHGMPVLLKDLVETGDRHTALENWAARHSTTGTEPVKVTTIDS